MNYSIWSVTCCATLRCKGGQSFVYQSEAQSLSANFFNEFEVQTTGIMRLPEISFLGSGSNLQLRTRLVHRGPCCTGYGIHHHVYQLITP